MAENMTKYKAEQLLGLTGSYDFKSYTKAYRAAVKKNHPDMGGSADAMIAINAAKAYLATYFEDDKDAVITCSKTDTVSAKENAHSAYSASTAHSTSWAAYENASDVADADTESDSNFTDREYTSKSQDDWSVEDWKAFISFVPPISYKNKSDYHVNKNKDWSEYANPSAGYSAADDNVDVSDWNDEDWYYYWFVNTLYPRNDGAVRVRTAPKHLYGPYAEREHASRSKNYWSTAQKYRNAGGDWVETPYGRVCIRNADDIYTAGRSGWKGNVGVPFAYAVCADYRSWLEMNLEAQKEVCTSGTPVAATSGPRGYGWTGLEFLRPEDRNAEWIHELELDDIVSQGETAQDVPWTVGFEDSWTDARNNCSGFGEKLISAIFGDELSKHDPVAGAPKWFNVLNNIVNHFPSRILFWVLAAIYANVTIYSDPTGSEYLVLMVLTVLTLVNVVVPVLAPVRWLLRYIADTALDSWEKKNGEKTVPKSA